MLPTPQLTEVLSLPLSQVVPIPDMPATLLGVCNWRGEVLWLVDLGSLLGFEPLYAQNLQQGTLSIIVVHCQGRMLGLAVSEVEQMIRCASDQMQRTIAPNLTPELTRCLDAYWTAPNHEVFLVLNGDAVFDCLSD
jgi:positive phototaxis protein PixI